MNATYLYDKYTDLCLSEDTFTRAKDSGLIPSYLGTVIGGKVNLKQESVHGKYTGSFTKLILDYHPILYFEEYREAGADFDARTALLVFQHMIAISFIPAYEEKKSRYAICTPIIKPVAIPLSRIKNCRSFTEVNDDITRYGLELIFQNDTTYKALLFTVQHGQIRADDNWSIDTNAQLLKKDLTFDPYDASHAEALVSLIREKLESLLSEKDPFEEIRQKLLILFEDHAEALMPYVYTAKNTIYDAIAEHLDDLAFTEIGRKLHASLKEHLAILAEKEKEAADAEAAYEKAKRKIWGAGILKRSSMQKNLIRMEGDVTLAKKSVSRARQDMRNSCEEILSEITVL